MTNQLKKILIANRGEIAIRVARAASELDMESVTVYSEDDSHSLHVRYSNDTVALKGRGPSAYLDMNQIISAAQEHGCDAIHPGYGFLSESAEFAQRCKDAGIIFIGPHAETLTLFGDKAKAREFASSCGVMTPRGSAGGVSLEEARQFMQSLSPAQSVMIKAVSGGGGHGMRRVNSPEELDEAFRRSQSEARSAFGNDAVYLESFIPNARHIEIQIAGDGNEVVHFGDRECSIQRRHQKIIEISPSPGLALTTRERLADATIKMAREANYQGVGTFEFLVSANEEGDDYVFIEANPRIQVEHTITEEVFGVDLVQIQLAIAGGQSLAEIGLTQEQIGSARGYAIQARVNMDPGYVDVTGDTHSLQRFDVPKGAGLRIETAGYTGYEPSPYFDSLLAKVIAYHPSSEFIKVVDRAYRALCEFQIDGVPHNLPLLQNILRHPAFRAAEITTEFVTHYGDELATTKPDAHRELFIKATHTGVLDSEVTMTVDDNAVTAPMRARILEISVEPGQQVTTGTQLAILEAMKMEYVIEAKHAGVVQSISTSVGDIIQAGAAILILEKTSEVADSDSHYIRDESFSNDATVMRDDLLELQKIKSLIYDESRPEQVLKRHSKGMRTARENIEDLCDPGSFVEYGALAVAAMHTTHGLDELRRISPADGFIYGLATINSHLFPGTRSRCIVASYDYTVFAGTQGYHGHKKHDRMFQLAEAGHLPVVIFAEGGGGRPADSDNIGGVNLANPTFWHFGRLSGVVPTVGIAAGRCFAGNAALLGMCDVVIATRNANIGMGGPVMVEGAGLGTVRPEDLGPASMHATTGVVDILADDEAQAVAYAKAYLSYFQGPKTDWDCADQRLLRNLIPQRRARAYDIRHVIELLTDSGSVLELRQHFGPGAVTALARIGGKPIGIIANNPASNAGAIGAAEAQKMDYFAQLCNTFGLPILSLCDTPGIMVGTEAEKTALVRHATALFATGAKLKVPLFTIVLRKAYGLGAMAMAGGSFHQSSRFSIAWPTAEFGSMGLEGQVTLGFRAELEAIKDPSERQARYDERVAQLYERGKATRIAPFLSIDDVIDPADSRRWIEAGLLAFSEPTVEVCRHSEAAAT